MHSHFKFCDQRDCSCELHRYWLVLGIAAVIFILEVAGGLFSGSLALLSDAGHVLVDVLAMVTSIIVQYLITKKNAPSHRFRAIGGYINGALLFIIAGFIINEAIDRLQTGESIIVAVMLPVAIIGTIGNYWQNNILADGEDHVTSKAMRLHVLSDLWQSVAVIVAGFLIWLTGWHIIDGICSLIIAVVIGYWGCQLIRWSWKEHHTS
ncbi:MAG: cation diffusion facilitator family transporter [bacterium]|nr:cation diffusion facilitator family transporter [bacterium]